MLASKSTQGFYDPEVNDSIPADAVEISTELHIHLLLGQSEGKVIDWGDNGYPVLVDPPAQTIDQLAAIERAWRDGELLFTDPIVSRHRDEVEEGAATTLAQEQYLALQTYRRSLRNWPQGADFPLAEHRPIVPAWLVKQTQ